MLRHYVSQNDLSIQEMQAVFTLADRILDSDIENVGFVLDYISRLLPEIEAPSGPGASRASCAGKIMGLAFYEPSTRTRLSFESAMLRLGGSTLGFADAAASSVAKGETLVDTIRIMSGYCDILVLRHPVEGSARLASQVASVPVINAGDGAHEHPTQTLVDLFTLWQAKGRLDGLKVGLLGDLKYGRTVHSLAVALARFGSQSVLIAPPSLAMPEYVLERLAEIGGPAPAIATDLESAMPELDALYATRVQKERFASAEEYEAVRGSYRVDAKLMENAPEDLTLLHPLPRVDEIGPEVDDDPRALYFIQARNGVPVRMALISLLMAAAALPEEEESTDEAPKAAVQTQLRCTNPKCVTMKEPPSPLFALLDQGGRYCPYCDQPRR